MRRILLTFVCSTLTSVYCVNVYADEILSAKPYVEENSSVSAVAETLLAQRLRWKFLHGRRVTCRPVPVTAPVPSVRVVDLSGNWCGSWQSCVNGHKGPMRASFCRLCDGNYKVTFVGRFCKVIPFRYTTTLNVTGYADGVGVYLSGSQSLGLILGTFTYNAWANDRQFVSGYSANKDQGQFVMSKMKKRCSSEKRAC